MKTFITLVLLFVIAGCASTQPLSSVPTIELGKSPAAELVIPEQTQPAAVITETAGPITVSRGSGGEGFHFGILELVIRDLAFRLKLDLNEIQAISIESVDWPNGGLGCPLPGANYAQVITPGFRITLEAAGEIFVYHTNTAVAFFQCQDGIPLLPLIPINPGEIMDGIPWKPVDPVPTVKSGDALVDPVPVN